MGLLNDRLSRLNGLLDSDKLGRKKGQFKKRLIKFRGLKERKTESFPEHKKRKSKNYSTTGELQMGKTKKQKKKRGLTPPNENCFITKPCSVGREGGVEQRQKRKTRRLRQSEGKPKKEERVIRGGLSTRDKVNRKNREIRTGSKEGMKGN